MHTDPIKTMTTRDLSDWADQIHKRLNHAPRLWTRTRAREADVYLAILYEIARRRDVH